MKQSIIDKSNPAYLYLKELQRSQEFMKKRNQTARLYKTKMNFMRGFYEIAKSKNLSYVSATPKVENIPKKKFIYIKNTN